ncbi:hypothetical protein CCACVL1_13159 [Corchorus capsularis]|uniref:Uncharacterized protein n=1 Tax=Corchorus capsularis TaxID=210143 RepID=A0A1R3IC39_COCAP|nr:hypothetical protein CCACVL1_13159 [Corchorus capsularis]
MGGEESLVFRENYMDMKEVNEAEAVLRLPWLHETNNLQLFLCGGLAKKKGDVAVKVYKTRKGERVGMK